MGSRRYIDLQRATGEAEAAPAARAAEPPLLALQRGAGNAAVARFVTSAQASSETIGSAVSIEAVIRRAPAQRPAGEAAPRPGAEMAQRPAGEAAQWRARSDLAAARGAAAADRDAELGAEGIPVQPDAVTAALSAQLAAAPEIQPGETVALPDLRTPDVVAGEDADAIGSAITYSPTITQAGTVSPFGATKWSVFNVTNQTVTATPGSFVVRFTLENPITFNVTSPKTSIASENDPALTNANFATAASDLTPNMSVQGGKPPRTQFWARDLTVRHERFHANERSGLARAGTAQAQAWLNLQTATSVADVAALIAQVPARVIASSQAAVGTVDQKESRAYGDGAPSYQARADAIRAKGAKGPTGGGYT